MTIQIENRIIRSEKLLSAHLEEEMALADIDSGKYYVFNPVATEVWNRIETETAVTDLCAQLCSEYPVPPPQCQAEVLAFLEKLHRKGMIRVVS